MVGRNRNRKTEKQEKLPIYYLSTYLEIIREKQGIPRGGREQIPDLLLRVYAKQRPVLKSSTTTTTK